MILLSYEVTNWGPHRQAAINFPIGAKTIALCAENDQGKSWIVRGIAFCLSIGRNEYGDQTAIHDGEAESTHCLRFTHNGIEHTIEKTVKGKLSDDEGTETKIDGRVVDRATFEEFYKELGLPHPSVWLPITVAMQNETDFHLRRKKNEREEALRAACQLTRIDNWKDALASRTNEEDKKLLEESSRLKGQIETLQKEEAKLLKDQKTLTEELASASTPFGPEGPKTEEAMLRVNDYEAKTANLGRAELEETNAQRELGLQTTALARVEEELKSLSGGNAEEEEKVENQIEKLSQEIPARQKVEANRKLGEALKIVAKKTKELEAFKDAPSNEKLEQMEETLLDCNRKLAIAEEKEEAAKKSLGETKTEDAAEKAELLESQADSLSKQADTLAVAKQSAQSAKTKLSSILTELSVPLNEDTKEGLLKVARENSPFGSGPIQEKEAQALLGRLLEHWEDHPHKDCPLCSQNLENLPTFRSPKTREMLLAGIREESEKSAVKAELQGKAMRGIDALSDWQEAEAAFKKLGSNKPEDLREKVATARKKAEEFRNAIAAQNQAKSCRQIIEDHLKEVASLCPETGTLEEAWRTLRSHKEARTKIALLESEKSNAQKDVSARTEESEALENAPQPNPELSEISTEDLTASLEKLKETAKSLRKSRTERAAKEKEVAAVKAKASAAKQAFEKAQKEHKTLQEETAKGCGIPIPPEVSTPATPEEWVKIGNQWRKFAEKMTSAKNVLDTLPPKISECRDSLEANQKELDANAQATRRAAAARKLINFLDYKNAPRKLLQTIVEKLFDTTNRIAEVLQADISLKCGKNLEFLTVQTRAGRRIEQRTERLGFGKGAVLGICFRLACQKLLLPETGFLILDEPTANVDVKRKNALKIFLQNLGEEKESKTQQIILIEHDADVIELCQAKIWVGENVA